MFSAWYLLFIGITELVVKLSLTLLYISGVGGNCPSGQGWNEYVNRYVMVVFYVVDVLTLTSVVKLLIT